VLTLAGRARMVVRDGLRLAVEIALRAERIGGPVVGGTSAKTFEEYAEEWRQAQTWKDPDGARYSLKRAYPVIGPKRLGAIDGLMLQTLQRKLFEHPYKRNTVEQTMHFVKAALRQAHADRLIPTDPTLRVKLPRRDSLDRNGIVTADQVPTRAEAMAVIDGAPSPYRAAVMLGLGCGMRVGEVLGLAPSRIDLAAGTLTIDQQQQRRRLDSPKTWRGVRTIEPPDSVMFELRRLLREGPPAELPLFVGRRCGSLRRDGFYAVAWRPALAAAGLPTDRYVFHSARHYAVSSMLAAGVSPAEVAAYVGDSVETITTTYTHFLRGSESRAKVALDVALAPVPAEPDRDKFATSGPLHEV
jgi:integrase